MMFSATTMDPAEYVRLIDWCFDAGGLGMFVSGWEAGGLYHAVVTVPGLDVRLEAFKKWFEGRAGWNVSDESAAMHTWPDRCSAPSESRCLCSLPNRPLPPAARLSL